MTAAGPRAAFGPQYGSCTHPRPWLQWSGPRLSACPGRPRRQAIRVLLLATLYALVVGATLVGVNTYRANDMHVTTDNAQINGQQIHVGAMNAASGAAHSTNRNHGPQRGGCSGASVLRIGGRRDDVGHRTQHGLGGRWSHARPHKLHTAGVQY